MKRFTNYIGGLAIGMLLLLPSGLRAQQPSPADPVINPDAMDALRKMSDYLRTLNAFQVTGVIETETVLDDGQKIQVTKAVDLVASRPNNLRAKIQGDGFERLFLYDGKTFTLFAPLNNYYATVDAPPTINDLAKLLEDKHDLELPLVDLFRWGTPESELSAITAAKNIGESACAGVTCQHYAFRQQGLDWEVWIQKGDYPLPRKIVLNTLTDEARPQHSVSYNWNLAPSFNKEAFVFVAPKAAKKIPLIDVTKPTVTGSK